MLEHKIFLTDPSLTGLKTYLRPDKKLYILLYALVIGRGLRYWSTTHLFTLRRKSTVYDKLYLIKKRKFGEMER